MTFLDWLIVVVTNGLIVGYGLYLARGTKDSYEWFLAAKGLPWWIVGLSMFATAVDSGDYVAVVGGAYTFGLSNLTTWWLGIPIGWFVASYVVFLPLYRSGMFTNAEYLEYRFGPGVRVMGALIQIQYRTNVLGNIAFSLYLTFSILSGWGTETWWLVGAIAAAAAAYTAAGGLKSVAVTDALQSIGMFLAALILWVVLWNHVGGWGGIESRLTAVDPALVGSMMHVGGQQQPGVPGWLVVFGWVVSLTAYSVVNHSQAMRLLAARSEWDMKTAALLASVIVVIVMGFNITLGLLGRALMPDLEMVDQIYPLLVREYLGPGLVGLVVAGVLAGGISTYDSIGSSIAAVFTRDIYARFFVKTRGDEHYLWVSRLATWGVNAASFGYIPFLKSGMVAFYLRLSSVAVIPLFTVYMMGTLTRVHRRSGAVGLAAGIAYGLSSFWGERWGWDLPVWWVNTWWAYLWSIVFTAAAMLIATAYWGWADWKDVRGLVRFGGGGDEIEGAQPVELAGAEGTWLDTTRKQAQAVPKYSFEVGPGGLPWYLEPAIWAVLFGVLIGFVNLVVLW